VRTPVRGGPSSPPSAGADQADLRRARRARLLHVYGPDFDLSAEIAAICSTLAARVAARPNPFHYNEHVDELAGAVDNVRCQLAKMITRAAAAPCTRQLALEERERELRRILAAQPRPPRPAITAADLRDGTWASILEDHVSPLAESLSRLLGVPMPGTAHSAPSASQRLEEQLRLVDEAAARLHNRLVAGERSPAVRLPPRLQPGQCRAARRAKRPHTYTNTFDLRAELEEIITRLQVRATALAAGDRSRLITTVNRLADAVHESVCEIADMVVRADAAARVAHVPIDARGTARRLVLDLAPPPPARPVISEAALLAGTWAAALVAIAEPYRESLSQLLFDAPLVDGEPVSEKLRASLCLIDSAALSAERAIEALARRRRQPTVPPPLPATSPRDKTLAELARLGVPLP
jgi:hypothetical protein